MTDQQTALSALTTLVHSTCQVLLGKQNQVRLAISCLLAQGHLLIEDTPGTGKSTLAEALARGVGLSFKRVSFTSDLLPADLTGLNLFDQRQSDFRFQPGPLFTQVLLADEINRASPRTQSALLEAMAAARVSVDGTSHALPQPFFVIATQNSLDQVGTSPLPEAQLDRFAIKLKIGYPDREAQRQILSREVLSAGDRGVATPRTTISLADLVFLQQKVQEISVHPRVTDYLIDLVEASRADIAVDLGVSPRGMMQWQAMAQAWAMLNQRDFVTPCDCLLYTSPSPRDKRQSRMPSSA